MPPSLKMFRVVAGTFKVGVMYTLIFGLNGQEVFWPEKRIFLHFILASPEVARTLKYPIKCRRHVHVGSTR